MPSDEVSRESEFSRIKGNKRRKKLNTTRESEFSRGTRKSSSTVRESEFKRRKKVDPNSVARESEVRRKIKGIFK